MEEPSGISTRDEETFGRKCKSSVNSINNDNIPVKAVIHLVQGKKTVQVAVCYTTLKSTSSSFPFSFCLQGSPQ